MTNTTGAAELPEAMSVEAAYSGDKLIGYVLRTSGDPRPLLVWADQSVMTGFRMGDGFVPGFQETIDYRPMKLYAENEALRAQPAGAPRIPVANLIELHQGLADNLHDGPARNLHLATVEALRTQPAGAATPAAPCGPAEQCFVCGEIEPYSGSCGSNDRRALCKKAAAPQPPAAEQSGGKNAQLATDSDPIAPGQQRSMAGPLAMGQRVGDGQHEAGRHTQAQGNKLLTVAERNLRRFLETAVFRDEADRQAALNCLEVLSDKRPSPQPAVTAGAVDALDAARYRWLREQHEGDDAEETCCVFAPNDMRECLAPVGSLPGELDEFIDAALAAQRATHQGDHK